MPHSRIQPLSTPEAPELHGMMNSRLRLLESASDLPDLDRRIIRLLQHDGRLAYSALGRELGVSEHNVSSRVTSLRDQGLININITADPWALGFRRAALIGITTSLTTMTPDSITKLGTIPSIAHIAATTGRFQFLAECFFMELGELSDVAAQIGRALDPTVSIECMPYVTVTFKQLSYEEAYRKQRQDGDPRHVGPDFRSEVLSLAAADHGIIRELRVDGRKSFRAIARSLEISEAQVRQRYSRLREAGIARVQATVDPRTLGFETTAWLGIRITKGVSVNAVAQKLASVAGVSYVAISLGRYDLFAEIISRDEFDLQRILDSEVRSIEEVESQEPFLYIGAASMSRLPIAIGNETVA